MYKKHEFTATNILFSNQIVFPNYMLNIGQKRYLKKKFYYGRRLARHVDFLLIFYSLTEPVVEKFCEFV